MISPSGMIYGLSPDEIKNRRRERIAIQGIIHVILRVPARMVTEEEIKIVDGE
jgi:hypothetical protein